MSHTDIIWIVGTLTFASSVGVFAAIRYIKLHTRPPVNTLVRSGDLELIDYIEPTQPHHNYPDLLVPQFPRESSTPPSYHTIDRLNINSSLEDNINLDYILFLILFFILGYLFFFIIKILLFKCYKNIDNIIFTKGISSNEITFTTDYQELLSVRLGNDPGYFVTHEKTYYLILPPYWIIYDIKNWIDSLRQQDYAVIIELIFKDKEGLFPNNPRVILTREFMVNNYSNPIIISSLISSQIDNFYEMLNMKNEVDPHILIHYRRLIATN